MSCQLASAYCATLDHSLVATSATNNGHVGPTWASPSPPSGLAGVRTVGQSSTLRERPSVRSAWQGAVSTSAVGATSAFLVRGDEDGGSKRLARWREGGWADPGSELSLAATKRRLRRKPAMVTVISVYRSGDGNHYHRSGNGGVDKAGGGLLKKLGQVSPKKPLPSIRTVVGQSRRREAFLTTTRALTEDTFWISAFQATVVAVGTGGMAVVSGFALREGLKRELEREAREAMLMEESGMNVRAWRRAQRRREAGQVENDEEGEEKYYGDDVAGYGDDNEEDDGLPDGRRRRNRPVQRE